MCQSMHPDTNSSQPQQTNGEYVQQNTTTYKSFCVPVTNNK